MKPDATRFHLASEPRAYDGLQLRSGFAVDTFGVEGDSLVVFMGPCHVEGEALVDLADRAAGEKIIAGLMLHFIAEHPGVTLEVMTLRQRLLVECARTAAEEISPESVRLVRRGDDIFGGEGLDAKLSVSVATTSPASGLIHLGVNIDDTGAPVKTTSLNELGIEPTAFARDVARRYNEELEMVRAACGKVRPVD